MKIDNYKDIYTEKKIFTLEDSCGASCSSLEQ